MIRKLALYIAAAAAVPTFFACNESYETVEQTSAAAVVRSFSFVEDDSVLANLDSVFFSIDLVKGLIFNADSMPKGTDITALTPQIATLNGCSVAQLTVSRTGMADTVFDYLTTPSAKIDFTNPVKLRLVSPDGLVERNYTIRVNVHRVDADSLMWARVDRRPLPSSFIYPAAQHSARCGNTLYCLTAYDGDYCLATLTSSLADLTGSSPDLGTWDYKTVTFPADVDINTFTAAPSALYILATGGDLLESTDGGSTWTSTGQSWNNIYGVYGDNVHGASNADGSWTIRSYPGDISQSLPQGMPVAGTSEPVTYTFPMSNAAQMLVVGGRRADGTLSGDTWGFDGRTWARVSKRALPMGLEGAAIAPYTTYTTAADWNITEFPTMILIGGRKSNGVLNDTVYISNDYGFNWSKAPAKLQKPDYLPALYNAQAFCISSHLTGDIAVPKIVRPVESWECPYIYLFGGINAQGTLSANVWRGVINRYSFKPVK